MMGMFYMFREAVQKHAERSMLTEDNLLNCLAELFLMVRPFMPYTCLVDNDEDEGHSSPALDLLFMMRMRATSAPPLSCC